MNVKVNCPCGTRFEFPVEPVNERMPVPINCPACGADATELANEVIRQQLAAQPAPATPKPYVPRVVTAAPVAAAIPVAPAIPVASATPVAPPAAPRRVAVSVPSSAAHSPAPASPAPASSATLRVSRGNEHAAGAAPASSGHGGGSGIKCARHLTDPATEHCRVCGKPICPKCMQNFGYVCSVYCREQADAKGIDVPEFAGQTAVIHVRSTRKIRGIAWSVTSVVGVILAAWVWYTWFARSPRLVYSADVFMPHYLDKVYRVPDYFRLIGPDQLLAVQSKAVVLLKPSTAKPVWTTQIRTDAEIKAADAARAKNDHIRDTTPKFQDQFGNTVQRLEGLDPLEYIDDHRFDSPHAVTTSNDIWVTFATSVVRLDRATGSRKDFSVPDTITSVVPGDEAILVITKNAAGAESITRVIVADGSTQSEPIPRPASEKPRTLPGTTTKPATTTAATTPPAMRGTAPAARGTTPPLARGTMAPTRGTAPAPAPPARPAPVVTPVVKDAAFRTLDGDDFDMFDDVFSTYRHGPYTVTGTDVAQFTSKLIEYKSTSRTITRKGPQPAPKPPPQRGGSVLDNKNLNASQSLELAEEMMGGPAGDFGDDTETEDLSVYEYSLHRNFAKDVPDVTAQMTGRPEFCPLKTVDLVGGHSNVVAFDKNNKKLWEAKLAFPATSTALETGDAIYLADRGTLMRLDKATGNIQWRLPSVGISAIQTDARGGIYVDSTTARPEAAKTSRSRLKAELQIMKVDPVKGTILWHRELGGLDYHLMPAGKFLFSERSWEIQDPTKLGEGADFHYNFKLQSPSSGGVVWNYHVAMHHLVRSETADKWIMLHFRDRIMVLKFFSL